MSGIAGIYHIDGQPIDRVQLDRMLESMVHRGPDVAECWSCGPIGLAHRMLRTTPECLDESQPLSNEDESLCLTADARIDNREELRAALIAGGAHLRSNTDAELILRSYEFWGEKCASKIIGDFAFAVWDARSRRLVCARDALGIKPFYYHFDGKTFRWASTAEAFFNDAVVPQELHLESICRTLLNRRGEGHETHYKNTFRLPPAHNLVIENGKLRTARYWDIDPAYSVRHRDDADYVEHFLEIWRAAVAARLRSNGRVGALLSGGLDSSSVVCTAYALAFNGGQPADSVRAFSIVFDTLPCDERPHIESVLEKWNAHASFFTQERYAFWLDFERNEQFPDCFYTPTLYMVGPALEQAQHEQTRVILTGIGGDDLLASSVVHLTDLFRQRRFGDLMRQLPHDARQLSCSRWSLFRDYCLKPFVPQTARTLMRSIVSPARKPSVPDWINPNCARDPGMSEAVTNGTTLPRFPTLAQQRTHHGLMHGWNTNVALGRLDSFASHFSIECRHPFFDRRLVEFLCAVPEEQRWFGPWRKALLRRAMTRILPDSIRYRQSKADFSPLVDREFTSRQSDKVNHLIQTSVLADLGLIRRSEFLRLFERYRLGAISGGDRLACHNVVGLELWCRLRASAQLNLAH